MPDKNVMAVEVAWATPDQQVLLKLEVPAGTSARKAVKLSGMDDCIEAQARDIDSLPLGVFGQAVADDYQLQPGDRVEIYRPLHRDPREARRLRARSRQN